MKTIAQQLNIKAFPFMIEVDNRCVYYENSHGYWVKAEYQDGKRVYFKNSYGYWEKREWQDGKCVYYEDSSGYWRKKEYQGNKEVYYENSYDIIRDNRTKSKAKLRWNKLASYLKKRRRN